MGVDDGAVRVDDIFSDQVKPFVGTGVWLAHVLDIALLVEVSESQKP